MGKVGEGVGKDCFMRSFEAFLIQNEISNGQFPIGNIQGTNGCVGLNRHECRIPSTLQDEGFRNV